MMDVRQEKDQKPAASMLELYAMLLRSFVDQVDNQNSLPACTQKLQEWNRPRSRKLEAIPVLELGSRKQEILKKTARRPVPSQYDPQPISMQSPNPALVEN